jgi:hypothetical protein
MSDSHTSIDRESASHGPRWNALHGGYFACPEIAAPLIDAVSRSLPESRPHALVDLGGGTGFLLSHFTQPGLTRINVDLSKRQLEGCDDTDIQRIQGAVSDITRDQFINDGCGLTLMMRSVLHYEGPDGLPSLLSHLRAQLQPGETFIHQTACFQDSRNADCLNMLYAMMDSPKWYPTVDALAGVLGDTGWEVAAIADAPPLPLTSTDLADRYGLSPETLTLIHATLTERFGTVAGVFEPTDGGFTAHLHYRIFTCHAV